LFHQIFQLTIADTSNHCILALCVLWAASSGWSAQGKEIGSTGKIHNRHCLSSEFLVESLRTDPSFFGVGYRGRSFVFFISSLLPNFTPTLCA
jgi:hypothetical protein